MGVFAAVRLDKKMDQELASLEAMTGKTRSDVIRDSVQAYVEKLSRSAIENFTARLKEHAEQLHFPAGEARLEAFTAITEPMTYKALATLGDKTLVDDATFCAVVAAKLQVHFNPKISA